MPSRNFRVPAKLTLAFSKLRPSGTKKVASFPTKSDFSDSTREIRFKVFPYKGKFEIPYKIISNFVSN